LVISSQVPLEKKKEKIQKNARIPTPRVLVFFIRLSARYQE